MFGAGAMGSCRNRDVWQPFRDRMEFEGLVGPTRPRYGRQSSWRVDDDANLSLHTPHPDAEGQIPHSDIPRGPARIVDGPRAQRPASPRLRALAAGNRLSPSEPIHVRSG